MANGTYRKSFGCSYCKVAEPVTNGEMCPKCVRFLAQRALDSGMLTRSSAIGTLALDSETVRSATYQRLRAEKISGQTALRFMGSTFGIPQAEPVEAPEYSVEVFSDAIRWEG